METSQHGGRRPLQLDWVFGPEIPTHDFLAEHDLRTGWGLGEAVDDFIYRMENRIFQTWEAVVCEERGLPLTGRQQELLDELISFGDPDDERILYLNDIPRPSEPWHAILNRIVPHLLTEPYDTTEPYYEIHEDGWEGLATCLRRYGKGLSLPAGASSPVEVVPVDLRHRLWLQWCFDGLHGLGQDEEITLENQPDRIDVFVARLRERSDSVAYFGLTLESLMERLILPEADRPLLIKLMQENLGLGSMAEPLADRLGPPAGSGTPSTVTRLSEDKIKQGVLHADPEIRSFAVRYFSESCSPDPEVMPLVVRAMETYGWREAIPGLAFARQLALTDDTLRWVLGELQRQGDPEDGHWQFYRRWLVRLLAFADIELLSRHEPTVAAARIEPDLRRHLAERLRLLSADPGRCWDRLERWCERNKHRDSLDEADLYEPYRLVEGIARYGDEFADRALDICQVEIEDDDEDEPSGWLDHVAVRLAGEMRLERAAATIAAGLGEFDDSLAIECRRALTRIGTDAVVEEVWQSFHDGNQVYRRLAAGVLERIHTDLAVRKCLDLFDEEDDPDIRATLGQALVRQLAYEAIEPVRQFILEGPLTPAMRSLRRHFLAACTLMEVDFPETDAWRRDAENDIEETRTLLDRRHGGDAADYEDDEDEEEYDEEDYDDQGDDDREEDPHRYDDPEPPPPPTSQKTGRNDPCPCGSGRKFKKCCLKKQNNDLPFE